MSHKGFREFDWDEEKNQANICKHCIDSSDVSPMFDEPMSIELDSRAGYSEDRWVGTGFSLNGVAVVVWTERLGKTIRIISARRANRYERKQFEKYLKN